MFKDGSIEICLWRDWWDYQFDRNDATPDDALGPELRAFLKDRTPYARKELRAQFKILGILPEEKNDIHALYRFFDLDKRLLYVGITNSPPARFRRHGSQKEWWEEVSSITLERFPDRASLKAAETKAIRSEDPVYNVAEKLAIS